MYVLDWIAVFLMFYSYIILRYAVVLVSQFHGNYDLGFLDENHSFHETGRRDDVWEEVPPLITSLILPHSFAEGLQFT